MKFCWTTLYVKSMEESLKFYEEIVGLKVVQRFNAGPDMEIVFLGEGETQFELIYDRSKEDISVGLDISVGFEINSIEEMISLLEEKNIPIYSEVVQPNPNTRFFHVLDPNGLKVQFVENIK